MTPPEEAWFAEVHREHLGLLIKTAQAFARNASDRDDLLQEILVSIWRALPQFKREAKLTTFVHRVALSCCLNWQRTRRRYRDKLDSLAVESREPEPAAAATDPECLQWLQEEIRQLPPVDRSLILLALDQVSYADIADVTGLSESNVGVRLHRIKQHLVNRAQAHR